MKHEIVIIRIKTHNRSIDLLVVMHTLLTCAANSFYAIFFLWQLTDKFHADI